jgi:branched-chain amino acid transport system substrate-binding protein
VNRKSKVLVGAVATIGVVLGLAACGSSSSSATSPSAGSGSVASAPSGETIKIGVVGSFGGVAGDGLRAEQAAEEAWVAKTNASGGINGHKVQLFVEDDGGVPDKSVLAVKKLVEKDGVIAIVGVADFGVEQTWASYIDGKKIPVIGGPASSQPWVTDPNFFPVANNQNNVQKMVTYGAVLEKKSTFGLAYCAEYPSCKQSDPIYSGITKGLGLTYTGGVAVSTTAPDYTAQCLSLKSKGAQSVFTSFSSGTVPRFISSCHTQGYEPLFIDDPASFVKSQLNEPAFDGVLFVGEGPLWFGDGPGTADYLAAMQKYQPNGELNSTGTTGWYSLEVFKKAIEASGAKGVPTSADVYKGLYALGPNFDLDGIIAPVTYAEGKPAVQQPCGWYATLADGKWSAPHGTKRVCIPAS